MIGPDLDMTFQTQLQNFDGFSNNQNTLPTELWEQFGQSGRTQTLPTIGCFDNNFLDKLFQTPTIPSSADESSRPTSNAQSPTRTTKGVRTDNEILGHTAMLSSMPQHQRAIEASPVHSGQMSSELASPHTKSVSSEDIKLYTTQILDLHRRSTRDADEYMATRHSSPDI
ncbi:uncharacterized protein LY89DRAFT_675409 [Mollisia scopiformis]|uniref:Uncharacterized protein n=1 Tax=Mollisia scopiformis TaxID=149040 RepID=A0A132BDZ3_MOLSC|nr:uncharacterized protein LY89DRAFT_675409 [Mollisia scopiformis]KUJ09887.1 hypothetical protein LY89DRAFT_675409 [Mollisia scopiformis]